jgi:hypothetical protein
MMLSKGLNNMNMVFIPEYSIKTLNIHYKEEDESLSALARTGREYSERDNFGNLTALDREILLFSTRALIQEGLKIDSSVYVNSNDHLYKEFTDYNYTELYNILLKSLYNGSYMIDDKNKPYRFKEVNNTLFVILNDGFGNYILSKDTDVRKQVFKDIIDYMLESYGDKEIFKNPFIKLFVKKL